jgi:molybdenum cofactor biosynthesis enzyme
MGMSTAKVTATLGKPDRKRTVNSEILGRTSEWVYGRTVVQFSGTAKSSTVIEVETRDPEERTAAGIGIGSTKAELKRSVKKARCESGDGFNLCSVGAFRPGRTVTTFRLTPKNRVSSVSVGTVID